MSPRRRKAEDADVFAAMGRVMRRVGPAELTLGAIAAEAGVTAGALVQRFGSKRELILAHWRQAAPRPAHRRIALRAPILPCKRCEPPRPSSPGWPCHRARRCGISLTCRADWADAALRRHWLRHTRAARARCEQLVTEAVAQGELRAGTNAQALARMIEVTLGGSFLAWDAPPGRIRRDEAPRGSRRHAEAVSDRGSKLIRLGGASLRDSQRQRLICAAR
jgi:AcrR family transcriptional regulator